MRGAGSDSTTEEEEDAKIVGGKTEGRSKDLEAKGGNNDPRAKKL